MFRKLFISLAPLLAIAAFAVMPVAAQATGHYYSNGVKMAEGAPKTVTEWGTLTLAGVKGGVLPSHVTCHIAAGGTVENPVGASAGVGDTQVFVAYDCENENICPPGAVPQLTAEKLKVFDHVIAGGWPSVLTEPSPGVWRSEMSKVAFNVGCGEPVGSTTGPLVEIGGYGKETPGLLLKPQTHAGTNAAHPGGVLFGGAGSGELETELIPGNTLAIEGELKTLGYSAQELINVKE
jgi:hypothetical protein